MYKSTWLDDISNIKGKYLLMSNPVKQHLIDPEICIRCHACEEACPVNAITHNDDNVVVDFEICGFGMDCVGPCPTGAIDNWLVVSKPWSLEDQFEWMELPDVENAASSSIEALDEEIEQLLAKAHSGAGGKTTAPHSASKPQINLFGFANPLKAKVQGNFRLTNDKSDSDVRHIILDLENQIFPVLEGQTIGIIAPGTDQNGRQHAARLYSVSSPRDGERPNTRNLALTVKREEKGVCSNYICDLERGDTVSLAGPYGSTFLMPDDPRAHIVMICTGTGSAPFRAFTMNRQRTIPDVKGKLTLFFGARNAESLPYFGPLKKVPDDFLTKHFCFSRVENRPKEYVQDRMLAEKANLGELLGSPDTYIYVCGLKAMEQDVEAAFQEIAHSVNLNWQQTSSAMRKEGRYHVETY